MNNATILKVSKQNISLLDRKKYRSIIYVCVLFFVILSNIMLVTDKKYQIIVNSVGANGSPVNSLYNDNSDIIFTNNKIYDFVLPINGSIVSVQNDGNIMFDVVKSIMVMASEDGVVFQISSTLDGIKFIKIKHGDQLFSVIENVDIIGVSEGDIVKRGQDIATAKVGSSVTMRIIKNDIQITNITVNKSKIIWE